MNSNNDSESRIDGFFDDDDVFEGSEVDLFEIAGEYAMTAHAPAVPDSLTDKEESVDIFQTANAPATSYPPSVHDIFYFGDDADDDYFYDVDDQYYVDDEDDEEEYSDEDDEDAEYSDEDDEEEYSDEDEEEEYSDEDDEEEYSDEDDEEEYSDEDDEEEYSDEDDEEEYSEEDDEEEYSEEDDEEEYSEEDEEEEMYSYVPDDEEYSDDGGYSDEDDDEEYSDADDDDQEEYSDDVEGKYSGGDDDANYYEYAKEGAMAGFVDINQFVRQPGGSQSEQGSGEGESVDLFELASKAQDLPESKEHGAVYYWAKKKSAAGWVKFATKCLVVLLLAGLISVVLYFNGLLNLIDFKAASDFEQFFNLSDTDYRNDDDDTVYSTPVYYNESTTIEGFNESMIDIPKKDVLNILLIGTDVRGGTYQDRGNTDSMILVSLNTRDKNIRLTSFMRDMYVDIPGREWQRLNAAYAYGGPQLLFDTLKKNFDVDVDLYVRVNFANFRKIVNHVGGVDIELSEAEARYMNKYSEKYNTEPVEPGWQHLDGAQALSYARCRKIDSDFNRTKRQRTVILALIKEIKGSSPGELNSLLNVFLPMIQTNMSKMQILSLMTDGTRYLNSNIETLNVPIKNSWRSEMINKKSVLCPNFELNKTAIVAHIYSTYSLDVEQTKYQSFQVQG